MPPKRKKGVATPINHTIIDATRRSKRQADKRNKHIESPPTEAANVSKTKSNTKSSSEKKMDSSSQKKLDAPSPANVATHVTDQNVMFITAVVKKAVKFAFSIVEEENDKKVSVAYASRIAEESSQVIFLVFKVCFRSLFSKFFFKLCFQTLFSNFVFKLCFQTLFYFFAAIYVFNAKCCIWGIPMYMCEN